MSGDKNAAKLNVSDNIYLHGSHLLNFLGEVWLSNLLASFFQFHDVEQG